MKILIIAVLFFTFYPAIAKSTPTCYRYAQKLENSNEIFYYWREITPTTKHGICANMYSDVSQTAWYVEKPSGINSKTTMSKGLTILGFKSRKEAESWAEERCPSIGSFDIIHQ